MSNSVFTPPGRPSWAAGSPPRKKRDWKLVGGVTAGILVIGGLGTACHNTTGAGGSSTATATDTGSNAKTGGTTRTVPHFVGMGLQSAQDAAQKQGFYSLKSHDSLGRDRHQILDRDWKVCSQNVKAGTTASTDTQLDFGAVKSDETCPAKDRSAPTAAGATMPDFKGKSVNTARDALRSSTSITVKDASGKGRYVLLESNWQVCSQKPPAGTKLSGQPVEFSAVKFGESCP
ncbi:PASTA domain-containing protein [Streptomyces sp. NBC_00986]|uniref:PASTA domain-containing protein n=1 Tax=Streptomyces sp. NBC_00986 TaxID=2903702 RepID=UPI0038662F3F|nr:PASTA domain-containing protein [Streptomyces sp. NBC_00986]